MKQSELEWFRPLWLRLLVTGLVAAWFLWEVVFTQDQLWMMITGAALAYAVWNLFIRFNGNTAKSEGKDNGTDKPEA